MTQTFYCPHCKYKNPGLIGKREYISKVSFPANEFIEYSIIEKGELTVSCEECGGELDKESILRGDYSELEESEEK